MTDRETEVARLIEQGMTNAEIAAELFITPKAVEYHLGNIYASWGSRDASNCAAFSATPAVQPGLSQLPDADHALARPGLPVPATRRSALHSPNVRPAAPRHGRS